jgi:hypothetical protein
MRTASGIALVVAVFLAPQAPAIVGTWHGTSTCVDRGHYPGCNNEEVIYEVRAHSNTRDTVTMRADKVVNGAREFMGESDFARQADGSWVSNLKTPRFVLRVTLHVTGNRMTGDLIDADANRQIRKMALDRK